MKISIGYDFLIFCSIFYFISEKQLFFASIIAVVIHELGHIIAVYLTGNSVEKITFSIFGGKIDILYRKISYISEIIIAICGSLVNIMIAFAIGIFNVFYNVNEFCFMLSGVCIVLGIFNLIPIYPLDGANFLYSFICLISNEFYASLIVRNISCILTFITIIGGIFTLITTKYNFSLLIIGIFLAKNIQKYKNI